MQEENVVRMFPVLILQVDVQRVNNLRMVKSNEGSR